MTATAPDSAVVRYMQENMGVDMGAILLRMVRESESNESLCGALLGYLLVHWRVDVQAVRERMLAEGHPEAQSTGNLTCAPKKRMSPLAVQRTSTSDDDCKRWLDWASEGDVIRFIFKPLSIYGLTQGGLPAGRVAMLERILDDGEMAIVQSFKRRLVVMPEETFHEMAGGAE
jgi:hypothetical protein